MVKFHLTESVYGKCLRGCTAAPPPNDPQNTRSVRQPMAIFVIIWAVEIIGTYEYSRNK
jgi:hypothetical protein